MTGESSINQARALLRRTFGHAEFRGLQAEVIGEALAGRSAMAVLPTGGGKSLCYQIPSIMRPGVGVVISPLIALMVDQVAALRQLGVAAARLDSTASPDERRETWAQVEAGTLDLLYLSPEGLMQPSMIDRLRRLTIALVAIDEAHCVSQWGHDFRPEYRMLGQLALMFPGAPRLAVTATADARTREDIRNELRLSDAREFVDSFARPELILSAERKIGRGRPRVLELGAARPNRTIQPPAPANPEAARRPAAPRPPSPSARTTSSCLIVYGRGAARRRPGRPCPPTLSFTTAPWPKSLRRGP